MSKDSSCALRNLWPHHLRSQRHETQWLVRKDKLQARQLANQKSHYCSVTKRSLNISSATERPNGNSPGGNQHPQGVLDTALLPYKAASWLRPGSEVAAWI